MPFKKKQGATVAPWGQKSRRLMAAEGSYREGLCHGRLPPVNPARRPAAAAATFGSTRLSKNRTRKSAILGRGISPDAAPGRSLRAASAGRRDRRVVPVRPPRAGACRRHVTGSAAGVCTRVRRTVTGCERYAGRALRSSWVPRAGPPERLPGTPGRRRSRAGVRSRPGWVRPGGRSGRLGGTCGGRTRRRSGGCRRSRACATSEARTVGPAASGRSPGGSRSRGGRRPLPPPAWVSTSTACSSGVLLTAFMSGRWRVPGTAVPAGIVSLGSGVLE